MFGKNSPVFLLAFFVIFSSSFWLIYGRDKLDKIIGQNVAKELATTTVPTTTEEVEVTTFNYTGNETEPDEFAVEEQKVLKDNPDPKLEEGDAYAVAWMDIGAPGYDNESISFTGEVRFIQRDPKKQESEVHAWFKGLDAGATYEISVTEYGDLVFNDSCWGAGNPYSVGNDSDSEGEHALRHNFTVPDWADEMGGKIKFNFTTVLAPLWGDYSVIGRMVVLKQFFNISELELVNATLRYAPETSPAPFKFPNVDFTTTIAMDFYDNSTNFTTTSAYTTTEFTTTETVRVEGLQAIMIGCGPVGIGTKKFSVLYLESAGTKILPSIFVTVIVTVLYTMIIMHTC